MLWWRRIYFTASQLQSLFANHLIDFGETSDQIHKALMLFHLTERVIQRKFRKTATSCLALDFACQLPSMVQSAIWGGALALWIATFSSVWRQVAGAEFSGRGDLSDQFVAL